MNEVTIIGLGAMGSALAGALISSGHKATVWNRTAAKAAPLAERGAQVADDPASAIAASPTLIICVDNYTVMFDILSRPGCTEALRGKTLIHLSTGIPEDARKGESFAHKVQANYLDGAILEPNNLHQYATAFSLRRTCLTVTIFACAKITPASAGRCARC